MAELVRGVEPRARLILLFAPENDDRTSLKTGERIDLASPYF